ncbi:SDR family NAD(P)-dependent oxidoreductase [Paracidobacterium acidisoli]|uniref:3-oxoacyl-ACP reductase FabG n=1 Tax=Paracidobacterium acidisoli TaxID=2303751 RepID=A0A372ISX5_9BACT|nr:3-oxoacyl-ACP reductase family protein [Paracidobacterium acidisoli]MBT9330818.1 3-oxoacyl-ACP reductase FabG [Paracidobacterium acidisoli]
MKLANKVALVTGAAQGIGKGIAQTFAAEGADVIINDVRCSEKTDELADWIRQQGRRAIVVQADVTKRDEVEAMVERGWDELGSIDILVNNAGIETIIPFLELTDEQWSDVTTVNLKSGWLCSQIFCRRAVAAKRQGAIVNIGSIQAAKVLPGRTHYAPSKLAIEALTRNVSAEMAPLGIRVNCIHPGLIETPMIDWVMKSPDLLPMVLAQISMGRPGQPCEIGSVAAFLASEEARYVTGQSFYVDGGWQGK